MPGEIAGKDKGQQVKQGWSGAGKTAGDGGKARVPDAFGQGHVFRLFRKPRRRPRAGQQAGTA